MGGGIPGIFTLRNSSAVFLSKLIPGYFFFFNPSCAGADKPGEEKAQKGGILPLYISGHLYVPRGKVQ